MADEDAIDSLLDRWEEAFDRGELLSPEALAHDRPDLVDQLARRIETLRDGRLIEPTALGGGRIVAAHSPSVPRLIAGRYRLLREIGRGGQGNVWQAHDEQTHRDVAIKLTPGSGATVEAASQIVARRNSSHVPPVLDTGEDHGTGYLVTELMTGATLAERIHDANEPVPIPQVIAWTRQVADALHAAHLAGRAHRDVKPANILLDGRGEAYLADFGIAIGVASQPPGSTAGTASYKSPEQVAGDSVDARSDVYGLALVVHEMLAGSLPAGVGADAAAAARAIAVGGRRQASPRIPAALRPVIEQALSARPADRHESAPQFARELAQAWRTAGRSRLRATWAAIAVAIVLAAGLAVGSWIRAEQRRARAIGDRQLEEAEQVARKAMSIVADAQRKVGEIRPPVVAPPSLQQLLAVARTNMLHEQYAVAEAEYTEALDRDPGNLEALGNRGLCRLNLERLEAAVEDFDALLAVRPDDTTALRRRASAHGQLRDFPRAIADLERAIALTPNDTDLRERLAKIRAAMNQRDEAEQDR